MDYAKSIEFLRWWCPGGPWTLTAIPPDAKAINTRTLSTEAEVLEWLEQYGGDRNIYFAVNPLRSAVLRKAERFDVASLAWLHVDVDPHAGEDLQAERKRILALLLDPPEGVPKPSAIIDSGGGYQAFWRLAEPMLLGRDDLIDEAARYNQQIELLLGADACHNVDRIMRLPGTVNRPNERKRKKGRTEAPAVVVELHDDRVYPIEVFTKAAGVQTDGGFSGDLVQISGNVKRLASVDELPEAVPDYTKVIIAQGHDPDEPHKWDSRSEALFYVCCELVRAECPDDVIYSVITDPGFAISESVLDKGTGAERYALRQIERAREEAIDPELRELNEQHAVVNVGGKCRIICEERDTIGGTERVVITFQSFQDFRNYYAHRRKEYTNGRGDVVSIPLGKWWTEHPQRRTYKTIVFSPERDFPGVYNLWRGFAFDARPGDCSLFLEHVLRNVCGGNEDHYAYLIRWMATAVQKPGRPGHTAIVLRGRQGTGKSFFAKTFGKLFGRHFLHVSDPKHLVGSFNAHLRDCAVLFGDEAFWAGDKKHESVLKMLVTEEQVTIEGKGIDAMSCPNFVHLIMASNEDWVVPAGEAERRFFVLDVSDDRIQNAAYFGKIAQQLKGGGYEALLHHLMTYDLADFNVRALPSTKALQEQKLFSLTPQQEWWYGKLCAGEIFVGEGWPKVAHASHLVYDYVQHCARWHTSLRGTSTRLGHFMKSVCPNDHELRGQLSGKHDVVTEDGELRCVDRPRVYLLPDLATCRAHWDDRFGGPYDWSSPPDIKDVRIKQEEPF